MNVLFIGRVGAPLRTPIHLKKPCKVIFTKFSRFFFYSHEFIDTYVCMRVFQLKITNSKISAHTLAFTHKLVYMHTNVIKIPKHMQKQRYFAAVVISSTAYEYVLSACLYVLSSIYALITIYGCVSLTVTSLRDNWAFANIQFNNELTQYRILKELIVCPNCNFTLKSGN